MPQPIPYREIARETNETKETKNVIDIILTEQDGGRDSRPGSRACN